MSGRKKKVSRRGFLEGTAAGVAALTVVPRHVLGGAGYVPPSETVGAALIGCGGRGPGTFRDLNAIHKLNARQLALCDVKWKGQADNKTRYTDFRRVLERKDIEVVAIATPPHWHALISIAAMEAVKDVLINHGIPENRIIVVYSGIDLSKFNGTQPAPIHERLRLPESTFIVGNVAHLADHKGQRYLIEAIPIVISETTDVHFIIAGEGELWNELHILRQRLGVDKYLTFLGFRSDVPSLMLGFDLFVISSHMEGLCTSIMDAQLAGVPVVATAAGGIPEIVLHDETGILVPPRNPEALALAILKMINEPNTRSRLAAAGKQRIQQYFSKETMIERTISAYRELWQ